MALISGVDLGSTLARLLAELHNIFAGPLDANERDAHLATASDCRSRRAPTDVGSGPAKLKAPFAANL